MTNQKKILLIAGVVTAVGKPSGGKIVKGFYRRNFTEDELKSIRYDDEKQTFVFDNIA